MSKVSAVGVTVVLTGLVPTVHGKGRYLVPVLIPGHMYISKFKGRCGHIIPGIDNRLYGQYSSIVGLDLLLE